MLIITCAAVCGFACDDDPTVAPAADSDAPDDAELDARDEAHGAPDAAPEIDIGPVTPPDLAVRPARGEVRAGFSVKHEDLIGGPKAEGIVGDVKLWNERAAFLIETTRVTGGFRERGGNVIDVDLAGGGEDRFTALWFAWNLEIFHPESVAVVSDGRDGEAVVRFTGRTGRYIWIESFLAQLLAAPAIDLAVTYEYRLGPDDDVLELIITLTNDTGEPADVTLPLTAMNLGDGVRDFGIGGGLGGVTGSSQAWLGMIGLERSYGFIADGVLLNGLIDVSNVQILQANPFVLAPGESRSERFGFVVGADGTTAIARAASERFDGDAVVAVSGSVRGELGWGDDEPAPSNTGGRSWVSAVRDGAVHAITPVDAAGEFRLLLPPGEYELAARAPQRGGSEPVQVKVDGGPITGVELELPALGEVTVTVTSNDGPVPVQIAFFRGDDAPYPFGPSATSFDVDWRRGRSAVVFSPDGLGRAHLLPGSYTVTASRGFSYTFDEAVVTVRPGETQNVFLNIERVVDDRGWIAADLHLHSIWSPDSDAPYIPRLRQAAANDIVLPVFTEHGNIGHAHIFLDDSGVARWVAPVPAQEVTTFEYGHFNAYPLEYRPDEPSFGAVFEHGRPGTELFDAMRDQHDADHIIQINHPRGSSPIMSYFKHVDFDRESATSSSPRWTTDWDVVEVFNQDCSAGGGNGETLLDWFAMNDHGLGKALGSGSDSHSEAAGIGLPRSWIEVSRAAVDDDISALVAPLKARKSFVSCGPFVRFTTVDGKGLGELGEVDAEGEIVFSVEVQAPEWIGLAEVRLLENGALVASVLARDFEPGEGAVRHRGTLSAKPRADAWYVLEVIGAGDLWPIEPDSVPYAMTNPIEIDADRDGAWTPPAMTGTAPKRSRAPSAAHDESKIPVHTHRH